MSAQGHRNARGDASSAPETRFAGYQPPTSNTTYTPNQLFDVVLPHASRGCLRLVAYLIQKTLRISDADGNPMYPEYHASYKELSEKAGIGRGRVKEAIDEAIERRCIDCLQPGQRHQAGEEGRSALYSLRWDERPEYVRDPEAFDGFFAGEGNYTRIPNGFFDHTIPHENLSVVRVVGVVIRHTIGWQKKVGFRRQQVQMSFTEIMRRSGIASRSTVAQAVKDAIERNHIERVEEGLFDPFSAVATVWGVKWTDTPSLPVVEPRFEVSPGIEPGDRNRNRTSLPKSAPKSNQEIGPEIEPAGAPRNRTRKTASAPESRQAERPVIEPAERPAIEPGTAPKSNRQAIRNRTSKETTPKEISKQQTNGEAGVVVGSDSPSALLEELLAVGVSREKAQALVSEEPLEVIRRQLDWLPRRIVKKTAAGLLIACIEQDLPKPSSSPSPESLTPERLFAKAFYAALTGVAQGDSMAEPTSSDERRAGSLIERLAHLGQPAGEDVGAAFGAFVRGRERGKTSPVRMLSLAVTLHADDFLSQATAQKATQTRRTAEESKKAHEERYAPDYEAFVASLSERLEGDDSLLDRFEREMDTKLAQRKKVSPRAAEMLEAQLRDETERGRLLVEFAQEKGAIKVPSFWDWDRTRNDHAFERSH